MYKVSIVIPLYNDEKYFDRCMDSIINQTIGFENIEVIIVDDCSTDDSYKIASRYANKYENVSLFQTEKNTGIAGHARNVGKEKATGEFLMFSDADDYFSEDACEILIEYAKKNNADVVTANYSNADEDGTPWENPIFNKEKYKSFKLDKNNNLMDSFYVMNSSVCNKIFKTSFVKSNELKFLEGVPAEDAFFSYSAMLKGATIYYNDNVIYYYRMRNKSGSPSVSWNCSKEYFDKINLAYKNIYRIFKENEEMDYYRFFYAKNMTYMLYKFIDSKVLTLDDQIETLVNMRWFYKLSKELNVPACQKSLGIIVDKMIMGEYKDAIDICSTVADIRNYLPKEIKEKMSKPDDSMYREIEKTNQNDSINDLGPSVDSLFSKEG